MTPWLRENVVPHLENKRFVSPGVAAMKIAEFVGDDQHARVWCYFGAYDWYFFCRLFGGFMAMPDVFGQRFRELAEHCRPHDYGNEHNALDDARGIMAALKAL